MTVKIAEKQVELSHGTTRYFEAGAGRPVLLLHGVIFAYGSLSWLPTMQLLASDDIRVIAPDAVGWGPGDGLQQAYSFAYLVDFVREFQDALDLAPCDVVGHSMGGWMASVLAYESPDRVDHLVLVASGGVAVRPLKLMVEWEPPTEDEVRTSLQYLTDHGIDAGPFVDEAVRRAADDERTDRYRRITSHMSVAETRERYATPRRLARVDRPTLVLWGDADEVNDVELGRRTHELVEGSELVVGSGMSHSLPEENPDFLATNIRRFLPG